MTDLLQTGIDWLDAQRKASLSRLVTYKRGGDSVEIAATLGTSEEEVYDESGTSMRAKRTDFLVTAADLILDGYLVTPIPGDRIVHGAKTYEVMALADGRHYVAFPGNVTLRIHAKLVDE
jgi:hypothetical protein